MQNKRYTNIVASALKEYFETGSTKATETLFEHEHKVRKSCFVTLKKPNGELRGCIGSIRPRYKNLSIEIIRNAVAAAMHDPRFAPVKPEELKALKVSVEVLDDPQEINPDELPDPKEYGLIIDQTNKGKRGVLLPGIEGVDKPEQQVDIIKRKAGIYQPGFDGLKLFKFKTQKYE
jgi:AmmeMemoRadiSam system protein A